MRSCRLFPLLAFALGALACIRGEQQPVPQAATQKTSQQPMTTPAIPQFSGKRAFDFLKKQTSFGPRNPNSPGHRACLDYLVKTLEAATDNVRLQAFTHRGYGGEQLRLANVVASFRPEIRSRVLLCAHWDTRPRADADKDAARRKDPILGANDGASGVAVLLEVASLLKSHPPPIGIDIVLFDGEDYGLEGDHGNYLLGSRHFAETKAADYIPRFGILLDMVGDANLDLPKELSSLRFAPDIVALIWDTARDLGYPQFLQQEAVEIMDDHLPLNEAGIKTVNIIDFAYPDESHRFWHTHQDTPEHCSAESLEAVGTVVTHIIYTQIP